MYGGSENLEDAILKANVPGRYSTWDKEDRGRNEGHDDDHSDHDEEAEAEPDGYRWDEQDPAMKAIDDKRRAQEEKVPEGIRDQIKRGDRPGAKTGPKGVLADYKAFKCAEYDQKMLEKDMRDAILKRIAEGSVQEAAPMPPPPTAKKGREEEDEDEDEEDDDAFLERYRQLRLQELQAKASLPVFGEIKEVTAFEFVDAVDYEDPRVRVVVHIYEPYIKVCHTLNRYLEELARRYPCVKFLRMQSSSTRQDLDEAALPMMVVYKAGEVENCFTRVHEEFTDTFTLEDVEWLLESKGVLQQATTTTTTSSTHSKGGIISSRYDNALHIEEYDDDDEG